jgi:prepilin-type N-terminal cleavage/methylation domain-containing protein
MTRLPQRDSGFTLIELAMVLFIVVLLIGGLLMPFSAQNEIRSRQETDKILNDIRDALTGFAVVNGYFPCPAPVDLSTNGLEAARDGGTGACPIRVGLVPWATLGLGRRDGWGNLFRYSVTPAFSNSTAGTGTKFSLMSAGDILVRTRDSASALQTLASAANVPVAIVSHGARAAWAYTADGVQIADTAYSNPAIYGNPDEDTNAAAAGTTFVSRTPTKPEIALTLGGDFDDMVIWISTNVLFNRMVAAGKLP